MGKISGFFFDGKNPQKVTPLFLVVLTLAFIDVIFAVDSVTAKVSSVHGFDPRAPR
jgi:predicted tellurium resistance membrane protein TerC